MGVMRTMSLAAVSTEPLGLSPGNTDRFGLAPDQVNQVRLTVQPAVGGWQVHCDLPLETSYFRSGARAERAARELAIRLSALGHDVQLIIEDRGRQVVGTQLYFAVEDGASPHRTDRAQAQAG